MAFFWLSARKGPSSLGQIHDCRLLASSYGACRENWIREENKATEGFCPQGCHPPGYAVGRPSMQSCSDHNRIYNTCMYKLFMICPSTLAGQNLERDIDAAIDAAALADDISVAAQR